MYLTSLHAYPRQPVVAAFIVLSRARDTALAYFRARVPRWCPSPLGSRGHARCTTDLWVRLSIAFGETEFFPGFGMPAAALTMLQPHSGTESFPCLDGLLSRWSCALNCWCSNLNGALAWALFVVPRALVVCSTIAVTMVTRSVGSLYSKVLTCPEHGPWSILVWRMAGIMWKECMGSLCKPRAT